MGVSPFVKRVIVDPPARLEPFFNLRHQHRVIARGCVRDEEGGCARPHLGNEPQGKDERARLPATPTTARRDDLLTPPQPADDLTL